jgi:hypothetical protein
MAVAVIITDGVGPGCGDSWSAIQNPIDSDESDDEWVAAAVHTSLPGLDDD